MGMSTAQSFVDYLSPDAIDWISAQGAICAVEPGGILVSEGTKPGCIFLVREGAFEVNISGAGGDKKMISKLGPGAVIGEMSWLDGGPASATIEAMGPCEVLSIDESALDEKVASDPVFGASFYRALAHEAFVRLRAGNARLGNA